MFGGAARLWLIVALVSLAPLVSGAPAPAANPGATPTDRTSGAMTASVDHPAGEKAVKQGTAAPTVVGVEEAASPQAELHLLPAEANLIHYVNQERKRYGLQPLVVCPKLQLSARKHCQWMANSGLLQHTTAPVAENIAMGQQNSKEVVRSWMNSPGHRFNILGPYRFIGATAYRSASGTPFWCLQFRR